MAKNALLIIYDFWISDHMVKNDAYTEWFHNQYLTHFPKPLRKEDIWNQNGMPAEFVIKKQVTYQIQHEFDLDSYIRFMMTQSNIHLQIKQHQKTESEIYSFMKQSLSPIFHGTMFHGAMFHGTSQTLIFDAYSWYIERN